jgi:RNA polymerase sigma factor
VVNAETRALVDDALDRNKQLDRLNKEMSYWVDMGYTNSNLQYGLLLHSLEELDQTSLVEEGELVTLERDILVHIEQLGALKSSFGESMSTASRLDTLRTQTSYEPDYAFLFDPETKADDDETQVIVRSGRSEERKLKRMRASEKASGGGSVVKLSNKRKPRKSRKSSSSQFISDWKNYPGRRRSIVREQSALLVTIKVRTYSHLITVSNLYYIST